METKEKFSKLAKINPFYRNLISSNFRIPPLGFANAALTPLMQVLNEAMGKEGEESFKLLSDRLDSVDFGNSNEAQALKMLAKCLLMYNCFGGRQNRYQNKHELSECSVEIRKYEAEVLKLFPDNTDLLLNFALFNISMKNTECAVELLNKVISINPEDPNANASLAFIYTVEEIWDKGEFFARKTLKLGLETKESKMFEMCLSACTFNQGKKVEGSTDFSMLYDDHSLNIDEKIKYLPQVNLKDFDHSSHDKPIIFIPCDGKYFLIHGIALVLSIFETNQGCVIHLHIMNPLPQIENILENLRSKADNIKIFYSSEIGDVNFYGGPSIYYAGLRLVRLYQLLSLNPNRISWIDVDSLIRKDIGQIKGINDHDLTISLFDNGITPYWEKVNCAFFTCKRTPEMLDFFRKIALFAIVNNKKKTYYWFSGQLFIAMLFDKMRDKLDINLTDDKVCYDTSHDEDSVVWGVMNEKTGSSKFNDYKQSFLDKYGIKLQ